MTAKVNGKKVTCPTPHRDTMLPPQRTLCCLLFCGSLCCRQLQQSLCLKLTFYFETTEAVQVAPGMGTRNGHQE